MSNIAENIANALLDTSPVDLDIVAGTRFDGAGIYAIYYSGDFETYELLSKSNADGKWANPIYVGKAVPPGSRKGISVVEGASSSALWNRLREHRNSIDAAINLDLRHFFVRWLVIESIWIPLGESLLINRYQPVWNGLVDGFGNHDPGGGRRSGMRSAWDVLHPGRVWASSLAIHSITAREISEDAKEYLRIRISLT